MSLIFHKTAPNDNPFVYFRNHQPVKLGRINPFGYISLFKIFHHSIAMSVYRGYIHLKHEGFLWITIISPHIKHMSKVWWKHHCTPRTCPECLKWWYAPVSIKSRETITDSLKSPFNARPYRYIMTAYGIQKVDKN